MRRPALLLLAALAFGALAKPTCAAEPERKAVTVGVGSQILNYMPLALGVALGHFRAEGVEVTVENFQAGGSKALQALVGGSVDGVVGFYDHTIQMQAKRKEITCVLLLNDVPGIVFGVRPELAGKVKGPADLKGLKLGVTTPGSSTDMIARYWIRSAGLTDRDVSILSIGSGAPGMTALENKTVDVLGYYDPVATLLDRKGGAAILLDGRTDEGSRRAFGGVYPTACLYLNAEFVAKNPETVQRLASGLLRTLRYIHGNPVETVVDAIPAGYKTGDRDLNVAILKASTRLFSRTGLFDPATLGVPLAVLKGYDDGIAAARIDLTKTYTNRFAEEAARRLGP